MGWLGRKRKPHEEEDDEQPRESRNPLAPLAPVLNVLVPDIAGVTSFHLRQFYDPGQAREFIQALPSTAGLHAFWGLHAPPPAHVTGEGSSEAMVLIRSADASDTVYVVSFVDLESADAFARFEAKRGMSLGLFLIYWAEIVDIEVGEDSVRLIPDIPPRPDLTAPRFAAEPVSRSVAEPPGPAMESPEAPAPVPQTQVAAEDLPPAVVEKEAEWTFVSEPGEGLAPAPETIAAEAAQPQPAPAIAEVPATPEPEPVAGTAVNVEVPLVAKAPEPETVAQPPVRPQPEPGAETAAKVEVSFVAKPPEPVAQAPVEEPIQEVVPAGSDGGSPDGEEDMDIEREAIEFLKASGNARQATPHPDPWQPAEVPPAYAAGTDREAPVAAQNSLPAEPAVPEAAEFVAVSAPVRAWDPGPADEDSAEDEENSENRVHEVEKILNVKRWDKKDSPFRGFDSPPGRF